MSRGASHGDITGRSVSLRWRSKAKAQGGEGLAVFKEGKWRPVWLKGSEPGQSGWGEAGEAGGAQAPWEGLNRV